MLQAAENADHNYDLAEEPGIGPLRSRPEQIAEDVGRMAAVTIRLAGIKRVPCYANGEKEDNAVHSMMLSMTTSGLIRTHFPDILDPGLAAEYSNVHDLREIGTGIDVNSFNLTKEQLDAKSLAENEKLPLVLEMLPREVASLILEYEEQIVPEARFVRLVDKLLPATVDILAGEQGVRILREDCGVRNIEQLQAAQKRGATIHRAMFPEPHLLDIHDARDLIGEYLQRNFIQSLLSQEPTLFDI